MLFPSTQRRAKYSELVWGPYSVSFIKEVFHVMFIFITILGLKFKILFNCHLTILK